MTDLTPILDPFLGPHVAPSPKVRVRVTERKCVVLQPVYSIVRAVEGGLPRLAASKQHAPSNMQPQPAPKFRRHCNFPLEFHRPWECLETPSDHVRSPPSPRNARCPPALGPHGPRQTQTRNGWKQAQIFLGTVRDRSRPGAHGSHGPVHLKNCCNGPKCIDTGHSNGKCSRRMMTGLR